MSNSTASLGVGRLHACRTKQGPLREKGALFLDLPQGKHPEFTTPLISWKWPILWTQSVFWGNDGNRPGFRTAPHCCQPSHELAILGIWFAWADTHSFEARWHFPSVRCTVCVQTGFAKLPHWVRLFPFSRPRHLWEILTIFQILS